VNLDTSIFHIARSPSRPLHALRRAAALEAKRQIERLKKLDLSDEDFHHQQLVSRWLEELRRHTAKPR
jgi:hypothetical protein